MLATDPIIEICEKAQLVVQMLHIILTPLAILKWCGCRFNWQAAILNGKLPF